MKDQLVFIGCFLGGLLMLACANPSSALCETFFIISDGDTLLAGADIESYSCTYHKLALTSDGFAKWESYKHLPPPEGRTLVERTLLTDRDFTIWYAGEVVAEGYICSGTDSSLQSGLNLWDSLAGTRRNRLGLFYARFEPNMPPDSLESEAFLAYFKKNGKLIEEGK